MPGRIIIALAILLAGCASTRETVRTVAVDVVRTQYINMPADLLAPCPSKPDRLVNGVSVGTLREVALQWQNLYGPCLESRLESIRALQPGDSPRP